MKLLIVFALVLALAFAQESEPQGVRSGTEGGGHHGPHPDCPGLYFVHT